MGIGRRSMVVDVYYFNYCGVFKIVLTTVLKFRTPCFGRLNPRAQLGGESELETAACSRRRLHFSYTQRT